MNNTLIPKAYHPDAPDSIIACVCEYAGLDHHGVAQLFMNTRVRNVSEIRKICAYLIRKHTPRTLVDIAKVFNRKDHTTCIHWVKWTEREMGRCDLFKKSISRIEQMRKLMPSESLALSTHRVRVVRERVRDMEKLNG
jgi:chromosomal replication initiation ATPase DnaA